MNGVYCHSRWVNGNIEEKLLSPGKDEDRNPPDKVEYIKRHLAARDTDVINRHLANNHKAHLKKDDVPMTADDVALAVNEKYCNKMFILLRKNEAMCTEEREEIWVREHRIGLLQNARPFKSPPFRARPKTKEMRRLEVEIQLKAGIIKPAVSEWAAAVLSAPKT